MTPQNQDAAAQPLKAAAWVSGAILAFTSMSIAGRALQYDFDTFEIMMYRSFIGLPIVLIFAAYFGTLNQINTDRLGTHALRNIFHFGGQNLWFYAITVAPLAQVIALEFTSPLWVTLLAPLLLGERLTLTRGAAAALGFAGILVVTRPTADSVSIGLIAAAFAAVGFAGSIIFTKRLTRTASITCILFYLTLMQAVFGLVLAGWDGQIATPSVVTAPWIILVGCAGLIAHFCLTTALSFAPAVIVIPFDFARLPLIAVVGMVLYGEPLEFAVMVGAVMIFAANYLNIWAERPK